MSKFACVTGADRGLGYDLTLQLLNKQYTVFAGRYLKEWEAQERIPVELQKRLVPIDLDVSDDESVRKAGQRISEHTDRLDLLINNAGIGGNQDASILGEIDYELIHRMYNVNAVGPLRMVQSLIHLLLKGESKLVVNVSSEAGQINQTWREGWYGYCMSKAALNVQSNIIHNQLRKLGGKVLVIHPGWMKTYMSGKRNEGAAITSEESAFHIMNTIERYLTEEADRVHPAFLDYTGNEMNW